MTWQQPQQQPRRAPGMPPQTPPQWQQGAPPRDYRPTQPQFRPPSPPVRPASPPPLRRKPNRRLRVIAWTSCGILALIVLLVVIGNHGSGSPSASASTATAPTAYTQAITTMTGYCTQDAAQLEAMVSSVQSIEAKGGVTESLTSIATHLATATSANGKDRMSCVQEFAAYATLRTGGAS